MKKAWEKRGLFTTFILNSPRNFGEIVKELNKRQAMTKVLVVDRLEKPRLTKAQRERESFFC